MVKEFENNEWALILGGSRGLGLAAAKKLAAHGMNICIVHRDRKTDMPDIEQHFSEIRDCNVRLKTFNKDILQESHKKYILNELSESFDGQGKIKCLLHSIAKGNLKPMAAANGNSLKLVDFDITVRAMALSLYDWFKSVFEEKLLATDSRILSFTSEGGRRPLKNYAAVSAAKACLEAITRSIALEFASYGVRANCVQAGVTDTMSLRMIPGSDQIKKFATKRNPFGRLTQEKDVANVVYLLCKKEAAWINGAIIPVDGGEHLS